MTRLRDQVPPIERISARWRQVVRAIVGDQVGVALFVGACLLYGLVWQVGFRLNDTWVMANTLVGIVDGHLYLDQIVYGTYTGLAPETPGMHIVDQRLYGRNYGQVFFAVPFVWALQALSTITDVRILLAAVWSLGLVLFSVQIGRLSGRDRHVLTGGCLFAVFAFGANVWLARPLADRWIPQLAFQVSTIVAAGLIVALLYRLLALMTTQRVAVVLGAAAAVGTPILFWAPAPKRHTMSALLVLAVVYSFARSRHAADHSAALRFRALAYAWVGLLTWVNAAEGLVVLVGLGLVDVLTARRNTPRELAAVGVVLFVSLLPFFATNTLVVGNPLRPANLWPNFNGNGPISLNGGNGPISLNGELVGVTESGGGGGGGGETGGSPSEGSGGEPIIAILSTVLTALTAGVNRLLARVDHSLSVVVDDPGRLYRTFIRSGWSPEQARDRQAINMTMLETIPLLGSLLVLPALARRRQVSLPSRWSARRQTDFLAIVVGTMIFLFYLPNLPIHASLTVRYLHPTIPLLVYAVARVPACRTVIAERLEIVAWSCAAGILLGGQLVIAGLALFTSSIGEAVQFHGLLNLGFAGALGIWTLAFTAGVDRERSLTVGAVLLGLTISVGTATMLFLSWNHLAYGDPILGLGRLFRLVIPP